MSDTITVPRVVLEQALEAFEIHAKQYPHMVKGYTLDAEEALRAALEQPQDHFPDAGNRVPTEWKLVPVEPTKDMKAAGAFAAMDQVRRSYNPPSAYIPVDSMALLSYRAMIAAAPQPQVEQEPVAWVVMQGGAICWEADYPFSNEPGWCDSDQQAVPLYTHPQPPRQPLTEDGIKQAFLAAGLFEAGDELAGYEVDIARAIEAAHGIGGEQE